MVSAVKVGGRRLHELARAGIEVERDARPVTVHRFDVLGPPRPDGRPVIAVEVECSAGTYVRTLAADLGHLLGAGAHLRNLRRTAVMPFGIDEAASPDEAELLAPIEAVRALPKVVVGSDDAPRIAVGRGAGRDRTGPGRGRWSRPTARCSPCTRRTERTRPSRRWSSRPTPAEHRIVRARQRQRVSVQLRPAWPGNAMMVRRCPSTSPSPPNTPRSATACAPSSTTSSSRPWSPTVRATTWSARCDGATSATCSPSAAVAREQGLWLPHMPKEWGGMGLGPRRAGDGAGRGGEGPARPVGPQLHGARRGQHAHAAALGHRRAEGDVPEAAVRRRGDRRASP